MPLLRITDVGADARLGLWRMDDDLTAFAPWLAEAASLYKSDSRRREYVCVRALLSEMLGSSWFLLSHNADGKPLLSDGQHLSISHTRGYCAVMLSRQTPVAVDIEYVHDRVVKVADHFLRTDEAAPDVVSLLLHWSAKETVYKLFSADHLQFTDMRVRPFLVQRSGQFDVDNLRQSLTVAVRYEVTDRYVLTYAVLA